MALPKHAPVSSYLDYSPTYVATHHLLPWGRSAIYNRIRAGEIAVVFDEKGRERITDHEIKRVLADEKMKRETAPDEYYARQRKRELARAAVEAAIAKYGREELAQRKAAGTLAHYEREAEKEAGRPLPPAERLDRAMALWRSSTALARAAQAEQRSLHEKYGNKPA